MKFMSKIYFEKYAQLTLGLTEFGKCFVLADKPDLQDTEQDIGIEVVLVETKDEGIKRSVWNIYAGTGITSDEFRDKFKREDFKQSVIPNCPFMAMCGRSGDAKDLISEMLDIISKKNEKFSDYKKFKSNGLYLFNRHMFPEQIQDLQNLIDYEKFVFDFYVINCINKLYVFSKEAIKEYDISHETMGLFKRLSLEHERNNQ